MSRDIYPIVIVYFYRGKGLSIFTAALITIAREWKQPTCSSTNVQIMKMGYIGVVQFYSL